MKKVIVTGANGFIGSWVIKELVKNDVEVIAVVRSEKSNIENIAPGNVRIIYCELAEINNLRNKILDRDIDVFYHFAWAGAGGKDRSNYDLQLLNCRYACDCATLAKALDCKKFICTGTITEKIAENIFNLDVKAENNIYGIAKQTTHCLLDILCKKLDLPYVWARLSNIYGGNNTTGNIISYTISELARGNRPSFSKAEQPYDLMYVKDTAKALYSLGEKETQRNCYFVGSGTPRILKEYLLSLKNIFGDNAEIGLGEKPEDGLKYYDEWFKIDDLQEDTGFETAFSFEEGIMETIEESLR
ncbi:NAD-dependent epimerase/dehydratase family protein [Neobacillus sp. NRS-1170]|uniref:NAD-dependent epimerase/dehydratase family protein n=1 Tax=Neobacillus sp. NRS-1170 TaxID=3233898 RepID=UPI003D29D887